MQPLLIDKKLQLVDSIEIKKMDVPYLDTPFHFHNAYEMVLVLESCGRRIVGNNIENFTDGDLIFMGPELPHVWYNDDVYYVEGSNLKVQAIVVYFHPDWLSDKLVHSAELIKLRTLLEHMKRGIKTSGKTKRKITRKIIKLAESKGLKRIIHILSILDILSGSQEYECLASVGYINTFNQKKDLDRMDKIYQYVMDHFKQRIKLEEAADIACMTPTAFCKFFKIRTQKTFTNFVNEVRIGYACKLLYKENLSISAVCYECGFNNFTHFNKNFKEITKISPSEFRQNIKFAQPV